MEEDPPGGDYASVEGDPSKAETNPPASFTPNPAGEQTQDESECSQFSTGSVSRGSMSHIYIRYKFVSLL